MEELQTQKQKLNVVKSELKSSIGDVLPDFVTDYIEEKLPNGLKEPLDKPFDALDARLDYLGYRYGLTYQKLPYDWRKSIYNNELNTTSNFKNNLKQIYELTEKKVNILAHSYGTGILKSQFLLSITSTYLIGERHLGQTLDIEWRQYSWKLRHCYSANRWRF